jgi:hypothetical protein
MHQMRYSLAERRGGNPHRPIPRSGNRNHLDNRSGRIVTGMAASGPGIGNDGG